MSHVAKVAIEDVKDIDALAKACEKLGLTFCRGQKTWQWFGQWMNDYGAADAAYKHGIDPKQYGKCEHAIKVPGTDYEIGLMRNNRGQLVPVYDFYGVGQRISSLLGKGLEKLVQRYGAEVTRKTLSRQGYRVRESVDDRGRLVLKASK